MAFACGDGCSHGCSDSNEAVRCRRGGEGRGGGCIFSVCIGMLVTVELSYDYLSLGVFHNFKYQFPALSIYRRSM